MNTAAQPHKLGGESTAGSMSSPGSSAAYEWGVSLLDDLSDPHRTGMTESEAREWVSGAEDESQMRPGTFKVIRRPVGEWESIA